MQGQSELAQGRSSEAIPIISVDAALGASITQLEVDIEYIADILYVLGLNDEQIAETKLHLSADTKLYGRKKDLVTYGTHNPDTHAALVFVGSAQDDAREWEDEDVEEEFSDVPVHKELRDYGTSRLSSESAFHELFHEAEQQVMGEQQLVAERLAHYGKAAKPSLVMRLVKKAMAWQKSNKSHDLVKIYEDLELQNAQRIASRAMRKGTHEQYKSQPREQRARAFAEIFLKLYDGYNENNLYPIWIVSKWEEAAST